jgi:hypothetical protein
VNTVLNIRVPYICGKLPSGDTTGGLSSSVYAFGLRHIDMFWLIVSGPRQEPRLRSAA